MQPTFNVSSSGSADKLHEALKKLAAKQVLVGVPEDKTGRKKGEVTNAQLVYLHTNGSELRGIPPRPIIEPAIQAPDNQALITKQLGNAALALLRDDPGAVTQSLDQAGVLGSNAAKRWFTDPRNGWAPDSPATAARKGSDRPLIDTGQMRRSITYLVEEA